uniref:ARMET N-terminal domain-containing protein n=1 Tax=Ditylenchus dipsaci TaxID=166011 RepID=A0A915EEW8_9BILA
MAGPKLLRSIIFLAVWALLSVVVVVSQECEVCTDVLTEVVKRVTESSASVNDQEAIKSKLISYCEEVIGDDEKREKFCFFIGAHKQAATSIVNEVVKPLSFQNHLVKSARSSRLKTLRFVISNMTNPLTGTALTSRR